jgi:hypothetical protein
MLSDDKMNAIRWSRPAAVVPMPTSFMRSLSAAAVFSHFSDYVLLARK